MAIAYTARPDTKAVLLSDAKQHLRVIGTEDDRYINGLIEAATAVVEQATGRRLLQSEHTLAIDDFPRHIGAVLLPFPPLVSITSATYVDADGSDQAWAEYDLVVPELNHAYMTPADGVWPTTTPGRDCLRIVYQAGYADVNAVPAALQQAILCLVGSWYCNRTDAGQAAGMITPAEALCRPYKLFDDRIQEFVK